MYSPIVIDLLLLAVLILFIFLGAKRGFVLTLCSVLAVIVALVGASLLSDVLTPKVADALQPHIEQTIRSSQQAQALDSAADPAQDAIQDLLVPLKELGGPYERAAQSVEDAINAGRSEAAVQLYASIAATIAAQMARGLIFSLSFLLLLAVWFFVSRALNLVAKLPVLHSLNGALGGAAGAVKGLLVLFLAAWLLCSVTDTIPPETAQRTHLLSFLLDHGPLDLLSGA